MKIGMTEILIILIVALFVAGPDKLPYYAKKFGEALRSFRDISSEATKEIRENVVEPLNEAQKPLREAMEPVTDLTREVTDNVKEIQKSFNDLGKPQKTESGKKKNPGLAEDAATADSSAPDAGGEATSDILAPDTGAQAEPDSSVPDTGAQAASDILAPDSGNQVTSDSSAPDSDNSQDIPEEAAMNAASGSIVS